ncbi:hypothetical protein DLAC_01040 [Tieghemostelium lacteum]|uniref:Uncharacterized protein n=1 Tax=Tieghemostelium lacteum TaxID=361077 RepID=A0A152A7K3_TIELA|nr:hypothetical protein DLAC_01040 [Tieghemostelium lacteum]|eukprot:KYR02220.1 hypothetical protein DLAC_01040 [Tieghemostelium lacteum]
MWKRRECNKCAISIVIVCSSLFIAGCLLLGFGYKQFRSEPPPPPYFWSLNLCKLRNETWVGYPLDAGDICPTPEQMQELMEEGQPQKFNIPSSIVGESIPYEPVFYITNNVYGSVEISHKLRGDTIFTRSSSLTKLEKEEFAICGGKRIYVYRDGPQNEEEGDYIDHDCQNIKEGCEYEPARSLNAYSFLEATVHMTDIPEEGSQVILSVMLNANNASMIKLPEAYLEYKIAGRGPEQDAGLALMIVGAVFADLMPATAFFLLQKFYYEPKKREEEEDTKNMIPLMELQ